MTEKKAAIVSADQYDLRAEREVVAACVQGDPFKVLGKVDPEDFYDAGNFHIISAIQDMAQTGSVITFASVCNKLKLNGKFTLPVENTLNEAFEYPKVDAEAAASIVKDKAKLRQLRGIFLSKIEVIDSGRGEPEKLVGSAISECINVSATAKNASRHISDISEDVDKHIDNIVSGNLVSYSTGLAGVDLAIGGVQAGEMFGLTGPPGCQPAGSKVLMHDLRWKNIEDVVVGDIVMSPQSDNSVIRSEVINTAVYTDELVFEIKSKAGSYKCSQDHILPLIVLEKTRHNGLPRKRHSERSNFRLDAFLKRGTTYQKKARLFTSPAVDNVHIEYSIHPYVMGALLGDGSFRGSTPSFTNQSVDILTQMTKFGAEFGAGRNYNNCWHVNCIGKFGTAVRDTSLWKNRCKSADKYIPQEYFIGSLEQRKQLLAGLMDCDGSSTDLFTTTSMQLGLDVVSLLKSIGASAVLHTRVSSYKDKPYKSYYVCYSLVEHNIPCVTISKNKLTKRNVVWKNPRNKSFSIREIGKSTVYGFSLDSISKCYITDDWIVTHNSCKSLIKNGMNILNAKVGVPVASYILEMGVTQELIRACAIEGAGVINAKKFRGGPGMEPPSVDEVREFKEVKSRLSKLPLWMDNTKFGLMEILADAERRVQENGVRIVTIDYAQLIHVGDGGNRTGELERISQAFRMFGQKNGCAIVMVVRLDKAGAQSALKGNELTGGELHGSSSFHYDFSSLVSLYFDKPMWLCKCEPEEQFTWDEDKESLVSIHTPGIKKYCPKCMHYVKQSDGRLGNAYVLKARDGETYTKVPLKLDGSSLQISEVDFTEQPMETPMATEDYGSLFEDDL